MSRAFLLTTTVLILASAGTAMAADAVSPTRAGPEIGSFGFDVAGMDRSVSPGENWAQFANGGYTDRIEIPADKSRYGMFNKLSDLSEVRTRAILDAAVANTRAPTGSEARKIADYYASFMDEAAIEARGLAPVAPQLAAIAAITDRSQLAAAIGEAQRGGRPALGGMQPGGIAMPVSFRIGQDLKDPAVMSVYVAQAGLGLPDRDYYLDAANPRFAKVRAKYAAHVARMFTLAGLPDAEAQAALVIDLEGKIAATHWTAVQRRQVDQTYNPADREALETAYPGVDWRALLGGAGLSGVPRFIISNPSAIAGASRLIASEPLPAWRAYLAWQTLRAAAPYLPKAFVEQDFTFNGTVLSGQPELQPRWKRGVAVTSQALGEALGKLYVAEYFPPEAKVQADALVRNVIAAMDSRLANLPWMDPATKVAARAKLAKFTAKIGYPDTWRDYGALQVVLGDPYGNARRAALFDYQRQLDTLGNPIDRSEWNMTPMTVNAYANPRWNEIVFPAAILQAPFFDPKADSAVNYGGIGAVIGHEISHHFDDQGRKYDKDGKLSDWWTAEDVKRFKALTDQVVAQYGAYEPLPGTKVNGELTLGENIGDLAGLRLAYDAYQRSLGGKPAPILDGYTGDQRLFLGWSQVWREKMRDAALLRNLTTDPHTPGPFRPNVVRNFDAWYTAFGAKPGEALYLAPAERVKIW